MNLDERSRKIVFRISVLIAVLFFAASMFGIVGIHYPHVIRDEPLQNPQKVIRVEGTNIFLENGTMIALENIEAADINSMLKQSAFEVDLMDANPQIILIYARKDGWVCGTPWAQPIRIPLIADTIYKNRREMRGFGHYVVTTNKN